MQIPKTPTAVTLVILALILFSNAAEHLQGRQKSSRTRSGGVESAATFTRSIMFSGYAWQVKDGFSGPGPNHFSDSPRNVWVDPQGRLHLRIERRRKNWYAAEVVLADTLGYGTYRFGVDSRVDNLDLNAVLGLFTWCTNPSADNCEIDIEMSRWGDELNQNTGYVVQPYDESGHVYTFELPAEAPTTHSFRWRPADVFFQSQRGAYDPNGSNDEIQSWHYFQTVPPAAGAAARINLWLRGGDKPASKKARSIEVVISSFAFEPMP